MPAASASDGRPGGGPALLGFGFCLAFFSAFGQTSFIGLFAGRLHEELGLGSAGFGLLYSAATLSSGICMLWLGAALDRIELRLYCAAAVVGLALACLLMSEVRGPVLLGAALFLLRLCGQGLMSHAALTSMARYFERSRGRALAVAASGFPIGQGAFPLFVVASLPYLDWRQIWQAAALLLLLLPLPLVVVLLRGHGRRAEAPRPVAGRLSPGGLRLLRDRRFLLLAPSILAPSFIVTAVFFHQVDLGSSKGWPPAAIPAGLTAFAGGMLAGSFGYGWLVDRLTALRLMPFYLLPLAAACLLLAAVDAVAVILPFMLLCGLCSGGAQTITNAVWAEAYGTTALGRVRAVAATLGVLASAGSPGSFGLLLDAGVGWSGLLEGCAALALLAAGLAWFGARRES